MRRALRSYRRSPHVLRRGVVLSVLRRPCGESLADLLRAFTHQRGVEVACEAFYNRLARIGCSTFTDIVSRDGSSFALTSTVSDTCPRRFTTTEPAAVDLHVTCRGFADDVRRVVSFGVVVLPGREAAMTRLCTTLPFSLDLVARRFRFGGQVERCVKEWQSSAHLHQGDTANAHSAEGLIWASLCAAVLTRVLAVTNHFFIVRTAAALALGECRDSAHP